MCGDGRKRLLGVTRGNKGSREAWLEVLRDLVSRGWRAPGLMTGAGAPGLSAALGGMSPEALRPRGLAHRGRNGTAKVSAPDLPQVKADGHPAYDAANPAVAQLVADAVVK
jgi:transposase-like protein